MPHPRGTEAAGGEKATFISIQATVRGKVWGGLWGDNETSPTFVLGLPFLEFQHSKGERGQMTAVGSAEMG